jgi:hypothetical protein
VTLWLKARAVPAVIATAAASLLVLILPFSTLSGTPSPAGATVALAVLLGLAMPVVLGWGMARSDRLLETASTRPIAVLDISLVLGAGLGVAVADVVLRVAGIAPAGSIAGRATATFIGFVLASVPVIGWRNASTVPVIYFVAVVVAGRGTDVAHPAPWAWIASPDGDVWAMTAAVVTLLVGTVIYLRTRGSSYLLQEN